MVMGRDFHPRNLDKAADPTVHGPSEIPQSSCHAAQYWSCNGVWLLSAEERATLQGGEGSRASTVAFCQNQPNLEEATSTTIHCLGATLWI